ncbi:MAG: TonB-dependent receptor plug domain-containing protein [Hyphomicrobiales bacterium]
MIRLPAWRLTALVSLLFTAVSIPGIGRAGVPSTVAPDSSGAAADSAVSRAPAVDGGGTRIVRVLEPIVVTASRRPEKALRAPASISIVTSRSIAERPALTPVDHLRSLAGVDIASKGIVQTSVVARGFGSVQSTALLALTDYRVTSIPSLRYNLFQFLPTPDEEIERIEVLRGPAAALYGPNSDRGVLHVLTKSPFDAPGTTASVTSGDRSVAEISMRQARRLSGDLAYSVSGLYARADDWRTVDPVEAEARAEALAAGADPATLRIGRRDPTNDRAGGGAHLEWLDRTSDARVVAAGGFHRAMHDVEQTAIGAVQARNWDSSYLQIRGSKGRLFAQAYVDASDAGDTYFLRTGRPVVDHSRFWAAQAQEGLDLGARTQLTLGLDAQWTDPRTGGTITGRNESSDLIREVGGYVHASSRLGAGLEAVAALRLDDHNRFEDPVLSPRAGLVYAPRPEHSVRLTYNRAYGTPATEDLFADLFADSLPGVPYAVWVEGVPKSGYSFARGPTGPLMHSPFTPPGAGGPAAALPPDATLLWDAVVAIAQSQGADLSSIPAPTAADVSSRLLTLQPDGSFAPTSAVADLPPLEPTITNAFELGYRGVLRPARARVSIDAYHNRIEHFIGHLRVITPNVFLDPATLQSYLEANGLAPADAATLAQSLAQVPLGTITPREARDPTDLMLAVRNFGSVDYWGCDASVSMTVGRGFNVGGTYSWVSRNRFRRVDGIEDLVLNAPDRKGSVEVRYEGNGSRVAAGCRVRSVASFPVYSGVYEGTVPAYTLLDLRFAVRLRTFPTVWLTASADNVLDDRHVEFVGAPEIGRLLLARLRVAF